MKIGCLTLAAIFLLAVAPGVSAGLEAGLAAVGTGLGAGLLAAGIGGGVGLTLVGAAYLLAVRQPARPLILFEPPREVVGLPDGETVDADWREIYEQERTV